MVLGSKHTVSIHDVAARAGVAISSVSRVLASHPDVSDRMRERVLRAVEECGYQPNFVAQSLRRGTSMSVGFVVGDISNQLMAAIALAAEVRLAQVGYTLLLSNSQSRPERDLANVQMFKQRHVDGLLLSLTDEREDHLVEQLRQFDKPAVLLDRDAGAVGASKVLFDHGVGFRAATEHLIALGHTRIGLIAGSVHVRPSRERVRAVTSAMTAAGLDGPTIKLGSLSRDHGRIAAEALLSGPRPVSAVICGGNQLLPGVLSAIAAAGLSVPDDVSLITTDNVDLAEFYRPPLATINRDASAFGMAAAEALLRRLNGDAADVTALPTSFAAAPSCGPPK